MDALQTKLSETFEVHLAAGDEKFYSASGDYILRVEKPLFKIYRSHVSNNSQVFTAILRYQRGEGGASQQGLTNQIRIILQSDPVSDFRSLLIHRSPCIRWQRWAFLVVTPHFKNISHPTSVHRMATLYGLCHKNKSRHPLRDDITPWLMLWKRW
ncbi:hypothetical protein DFH09DRAFT_1343521 [Mycena vulgaris]|nr:hypothetical protein DFH09DRAFT_1343521 [Mycena vulgaris]